MLYEVITQEDKQQTLLQCLFLGVGASLMIPLFLKFTSFNFKPETATTEEFLELIGLCLIASIFARRFITSIGDKVLMEQLKKKISNIEEGVEEIVTEGYDEKSNEFKKEDFIEIDGNELAVLEAMKNKLPQKRRKVRITSYNVCYTKLLRLLTSMVHGIIKEQQKQSTSIRIQLGQESILNQHWRKTNRGR